MTEEYKLFHLYLSRHGSPVIQRELLFKVKKQSDFIAGGGGLAKELV